MSVSGRRSSRVLFRIWLVLSFRSEKDLRVGSFEAPEGNRIGKNAETRPSRKRLRQGPFWEDENWELESGTQDPARIQGPRYIQGNNWEERGLG